MLTLVHPEPTSQLALGAMALGFAVFLFALGRARIGKAKSANHPCVGLVTSKRRNPVNINSVSPAKVAIAFGLVTN